MSEIAGRVLMIPKGTYSPTTTYDPLDAVKYEQNSYVCKQTSRGNLPTNTTYWQPLTDVTADEIPTEGSTNLVQSGGVYSANQTLTNQVNYNTENGVKNLFHFQSLESSSYLNINWTFDGVENTIKMNSSSASISGSYFVQKELELDPSKQYVFKATFDSGINNGLWLTIVPSNEDATYRKAISPSTPMIEYTPKAGVTKYFVYVYTNASMTYSNYNIANIMVVEKDVYNFNPSYEPYAEPNSVLTQKTTGLIDNQNVNGAVNMLPLTGKTLSSYGVTWQVNADETVTVSGDNTTASNWSTFDWGTVPMKAGKTYKIILRRSAYNSAYVTLNKGSTPQKTLILGTDNEYIGTYTPTEDVNILVRWAVQYGTSAGNNVVLQSMITCSAWDGNEVVPYAKTNKELTDDVAVKSSEITVNTTNVDSESITRNYVNKSAGVKVLVLQAKSKIDLLAGTTYELGTVPSDYLPTISTGFVKEDVVNSEGSTALIEVSSGKLKLTPRVNNITTAKSFVVSVTYI